MSNNIGTTDTVLEFKRSTNADAYITVQGKALSSSSYMAEAYEEYMSLQFGEPAFPLKSIRVSEINDDIKDYIANNPNIKFYKEPGKKNWTPLARRFPRKNKLCYLGEILDPVWWEMCMAKYDPKKNEYSWGIGCFEKQGFSDCNYEYIEDDTIVMIDDMYENYACYKDGADPFVYRYWLRRYTFSCYKEALHFIEDELTGNIGDIKIRYGGTSNWKTWKEPSEYAKDIKQSWFGKNKYYEYTGCWFSDDERITTKTRPAKNQIIISEFADA